MNNLNKILPYIKYDLQKTGLTTIKVFVNRGNGYEWLRKDKLYFTIDEVLKCRKPYEVVDYTKRNHCLFLKEKIVTIYDYFLQCQIDTLVEKGFLNKNIIWNSYKSKKAMNDDILERLKKKNPNNTCLTLKEFSEYYDVPWFLEVR